MLVASIVVIGIVIILYLVTPWIFIGYCPFNLCAPHRSFTVLELQLPTDIFIEGTIDSPMTLHRPTTSEGAFEHGIGGARWDNKLQVAYSVWRYAKEKDAITFYQQIQNASLSNATPFDNLHAMEIADDYVATCGEPINVYMGDRACSMNARIKEYVFSLTINGDDKEAIDLFNRVVDYIDKDMRQKMGIVD